MCCVLLRLLSGYLTHTFVACVWSVAASHKQCDVDRELSYGLLYTFFFSRLMQRSYRWFDSHDNCINAYIFDCAAISGSVKETGMTRRMSRQPVGPVPCKFDGDIIRSNLAGSVWASTLC